MKGIYKIFKVTLIIESSLDKKWEDLVSPPDPTADCVACNKAHTGACPHFPLAVRL